MKTLLSFVTYTIFIIFYAIPSAAQISDYDGNTYNIITIGSQEWTGENLSVAHFNNGDPIMEARTYDEWREAQSNGTPAWCYFEGDSGKGRLYGKFYNWYAVSDPRGLAPDGWRIPTNEDWVELSDYLGGDAVAGEKMKATHGWEGNPNSNSSGFSALASGNREPFGRYGFEGKLTAFWSSSEYDSEKVWIRFLSHNSDKLGEKANLKNVAISIRLVRE